MLLSPCNPGWIGQLLARSDSNPHRASPPSGMLFSPYSAQYVQSLHTGFHPPLPPSLSSLLHPPCFFCHLSALQHRAFRLSGKGKARGASAVGQCLWPALGAAETARLRASLVVRSPRGSAAAHSAECCWHIHCTGCLPAWHTLLLLLLLKQW